MALNIAFVAKNPFALSRAKNEFAAEFFREIATVYGVSEICRIRMKEGTDVYFLSEADYLRGKAAGQRFDQIFVAGAEALSVDFKLFLHECLCGSCVPKEFQWQKWEGAGGRG